MTHGSLLSLLLLLCAPPPPPGERASPTPTAPPAASASPAPTATVLAHPPGPSLRETQRAALERSGTRADQPRQWQRRARRAALLPELQTGYELRVDRGLDLDQAAGTADELSTDLGHAHVGRVRLTWSLDRAVFNPDELRVLRASLDLLDWQRATLADVTTLWFDRVRLWRAIQIEGHDPDLDLQLREVEGLLEALTGLRFLPASSSDLLG